MIFERKIFLPFFFLGSFLFLSGCGNSSSLSSVDEFIESEKQSFVTPIVQSQEGGSFLGSGNGMNDSDANIIINDMSISDGDDTSTTSISQEVRKDGYREFSKEAVALALRNKDTIIFHFYDEDSLVDSAFRKDVQSNLSSIPLGVTIFARSYDAEDPLVSQYNVKKENTFIFVDDQLQETYRMSKGIVILETILKRLP